MKQQQILLIIIAAVILLLAGSGALLYGLSQGGTLPGLVQRPEPSPPPLEIPRLEITPPPSLATIAAELRTDYPELADLLENPELGSVYKDFYLAYQQGGQETALALARQRGILNDQNEIEMTLVLDTEETAPLVAELEAEGVRIQASYSYKINIAIPVSLIQTQLETGAANLIVERISNLRHVIRLELPNKANIKQRIRLGQGVGVTFAGNWHAQGLTGQGVKIGVLDLGFGGYEALLGVELPETVAVKIFGDDLDFATEVHGTACAEIVHEMAPQAALYLAYYDGTDAAMGEAVEWLVSQGVDIISNSTGSNGLTPLDGSGFVAEQIVDRAQAAGVFWVNAAGNEADVHYRGRFSDSDGDNLHEFSPGVELLPFVPLEYELFMVLSWDDWDQVDQDYEFILYDSDGNLLAKSEDPQDGQAGQIPAEGFWYEFEDEQTYFLAIENYDGLARGDATFDIFIEGGEIPVEYQVVDYSLSNPADARGAFAVGAVYWADDALEFYSSRGPTNDGRLKPDLAAPSVVDSASYAPDAFDGTSAAAPHVAGAAALVLQAFPDLSPVELGQFLQARSIDLGPAGPDNSFGAGRLNLGASPDDPAAPVATPTLLAEVQPTSTPRPAAAIGSLNPAGQPAAGPQGTEDVSGFVVLSGLCLMCLAGLLAGLGLMIWLVVRRRK